MQYDTESEVDVDLFRRRMGFLGMVSIAFTCGVYLMTHLRSVLEPFTWALFMVIALKPLATLFESFLLCIGRWICGCGAGAQPRAGGRRNCRLRRGQHEELAGATEGEEDGEESGELWRVTDHADVESFCSSCCACVSRVVAVTCALAVVIAVMCGFAMLIFEGAVRVKDNFPVYDKGARNAVESIKGFAARVFGHMPRSVVDEISEKALSSIQALVSSLASQLLSLAGSLLVEFLMLALYVMFWLCTPMPLSGKTEHIFRRYFLLKGLACGCYAVCVGVMLNMLQVELAMIFGLMSFFLSFIPEVGAFIAMILPVPVILFDSRLEAPFLTLLTAMAGQMSLKFVFANIIEVKLIENDSTMKMHPVITLLTVTFFGFIWGPTGMMLSVPMMTYLKVVILSDLVPPSYRNPVLILLEGDRRAPERFLRRKQGDHSRLRAAD